MAASRTSRHCQRKRYSSLGHSLILRPATDADVLTLTFTHVDVLHCRSALRMRRRARCASRRALPADASWTWASARSTASTPPTSPRRKSVRSLPVSGVCYTGCDTQTNPSQPRVHSSVLERDERVMHPVGKLMQSRVCRPASVSSPFVPLA